MRIVEILELVSVDDYLEIGWGNYGNNKEELLRIEPANFKG